MYLLPIIRFVGDTICSGLVFPDRNLLTLKFLTNEELRRKFNATFKTKVLLEALKESKTVWELAEQFELPPNRISTGKEIFREG